MMPVLWLDSDLTSSSCNLASVRRLPDGIGLTFGASQSRPTGELGIVCLQRVHLEPVAARRLRDLLVKLIGDHEARYRKTD